MGIAGLELHGKSGLLRSVVVNERYRGLGHGRTLVGMVIGNARTKGVETVYLLTDTAKTYFEGLGFEVVERSYIEEPVKLSPEFTGGCETAVAMRKVIT